MVNFWKEVKGKVKEYRKQAKQTLDLKVEQLALEKEFVGLVTTTPDDAVTKTKVKRAVNNFDNFLSRFSSSKQFLEFLSNLNYEDIPKEVVSFRSEYKSLLEKNVTHGRFLRWCNFTVYPKRILIMRAFHVFYGNVPKRYTLTTIVSGIRARGLKSKRRNSKDKGLISEFVYKFKRQVNYITMFIRCNCGLLNRGVEKNFEPVYSKDEQGEIFGEVTNPDSYGDVSPTWHRKKVSNWNANYTRVSPKYIVAKYGALRSYAFKYMKHYLTSFGQKKKAQKLIASRAKRIDSWMDKGVNWSHISTLIRNETGKDLFKGLNINDKAINRRLTVAFKLLKQKRFNNLLTATDDIDNSKNRDERTKVRKKLNASAKEFLTALDKR